MIKAAGLVKYYGTTIAVNQVSFDVPTGQNMVLLGPSGCGKTTTLRLINRLVTPDSGTISINGTDIYDQPAEQLRRGIGYVLQHHGLFPHYTVGENVAIVPKLLKWDAKRIGNRTEELFSKLKLDPSLMNKHPSALSGGQQQRVGLVRALMVNPPVLLMDEPFGALDNLTRLAIRKEFRELDELKNKTIVMVTHDIQEAFEMGDTICLMNKGEVMQLAEPATLLQHPVNVFVSEFLKEQRLLLALKFFKLGEQSAWEAMNGMAEVELKALLRSIIKQ